MFDRHESIHPALQKVEGLEDEDRRKIWDDGTVVTVPAGWSMVHEHEPPDEAYLVLEGRVRITLDRERVATLGPGEFVGEIGPVERRLRTATATAMEPLLTLAFPSAVFADLRRTLPRFEHAVTTIAGARLSELEAP